MLSITYFIDKLFSNSEQKEMNVVDQALQKIKAALVYKGLDYSAVFAESTKEGLKR